MYIYMNIYIYDSVHIHIHMHVPMHIHHCTYTYTYTCMRPTYITLPYLIHYLTLPYLTYLSSLRSLRMPAENVRTFTSVDRHQIQRPTKPNANNADATDPFIIFNKAPVTWSMRKRCSIFLRKAQLRMSFLLLLRCICMSPDRLGLEDRGAS